MSDVKKCPHCGKLIHSNAQYCMFCMTSLVPKQDITPRLHKSNKKGILGILALSLAVLLVISLPVLYLLLKSPTDWKTMKNKENTREFPWVNTDSNDDPHFSDTGLPDPVSPSGDSQPSTEDKPSTDAPVQDLPNTDQPVVQPQPTCNHTYTAATCTKPQTCTACGETTGTTAEHQWKSATCTDPMQCSVCSKTQGTALGHNYTAATCTKPQTCTACGETTGSALGHQWKSATCTVPMQCSVCSKTQGTALGHNYTAATCVAPMTCTTCGSTAGTANTSAHAYQPVYSNVHYDEVGHYENVEVSYEKTLYLCFFCGYSQEGYDSLDDLREHMRVHSEALDYAYVISRPDLLAGTREVWATKYELQWVVDEKAHDERVLTGYTCTLCNSKKDP